MVEEIFKEILSIDIKDNVYFELVSIKDIRITDEYGGFRLNIKGTFYKIRTNFFIEITTGDIITPREIKYKYSSIFEDKKINIMAYTIETIIAEKFESIISKNITTTRAKDFYDLYMLIDNHKDEINNGVLKKAVINTFNKRNTTYDINLFRETLEILESSDTLKNVFIDYQSKLVYPQEVEYKKTIEALNLIIDILSK